MAIFNLQHTIWKKASLLVFFVLLFSCFSMTSCILYDQPHDYCYERDWDYPEYCWETYYREECCEWKVSYRCVEIWCSDLDYHGHNECLWRLEDKHCH